MDVKKRVGIIGTGSSVPDKILTNEDLERMVETSDEWITTRTGIKERRIADEETATSDLATEAALLALDNAGLKAKDIDMIIVATVTPDMPFPSTACFVQHNLGAENAVAFDINAACPGLIYAIQIAESFILSGKYENVLTIGVETLSKIVDWEDRSTCVLFGDGAGATVISEVEEGKGILAKEMKSDGSLNYLLHMPGGGSRNPTSPETIEQKMHYIKMEGNEVYKHAVKAMTRSSKNVLKAAGLTHEDVDWLIPHQANIRIMEAVAKRLKIPREKVYVNIDKHGNTSAASIGIAMDEGNRNNSFKPGDIILMTSFGAGFTWGSVVGRW
jgi:3-oxoacyl-[acyl-carrier-protein] synthase-3